MKKGYLAALLWGFCFSIWGQGTLSYQKLPAVMQQFFHMHITHKQLTPALTQKMVSLYVAQFDPHKVYLLQSEAQALQNLPPQVLERICQQIKSGDFSFFIRLNEALALAVTRSRQIQRTPVQWTEEKKIDQTQFAKNFSELMYRVQWRNQEHASSMKSIQKKEEKFLAYKDPEQESFFALLVMKAFARSLDAHSSYFSKEEAMEMRANLEKQFEGVGVVLAPHKKGVVITQILSGSPASNGQLQKDDVVVEINGIDIASKSYEEILQLMKETKQKIQLGVQRQGTSSTIYVELKKAPIHLDQESLSYSYEKVEGGIIAKIKLHAFYENQHGVTSEKDIKKALIKLSNIAPIKGVILDLRNNTGGFLTQAVKVAGLFISSGVVVVAEYCGGQKQVLRKFDTKAFYSGPLIVLTSKLSASAAEIVAQSLQDYGVALVVGDYKTFGKGSIQHQTVTDKNAPHFFSVTVGRYYTVSGKSTQMQGVQADIVVPTHFSAIELGENLLPNVLPGSQISSYYEDPLTDLKGPARMWLQKNYLPFLQKKVGMWRAMLPFLQEKSQKRLAQNQDFQAYLIKKQKLNESMKKGKNISASFAQMMKGKDFSMQEALQIMQDMLVLQNKQQKALKSPFSHQEYFLPHRFSQASGF